MTINQGLISLQKQLLSKPGFFWPFEKKLKAKKTQNSRKKLKLKLKTQIFGIFRKNSTYSETCFIQIKTFVLSWLDINIHNTCLLTKSIKIAFKFCYCSNKDWEAKAQTQRKNSKFKKKTLKTKGKNSKLKKKTQFFGIFRILRCEKDDQKKATLGIMFIWWHFFQKSND